MKWSISMNKEECIENANRCLSCKNPTCVEACPIKMNIPGFISKIKEENIEEAYNIIKEKSYLGAICGRICPHETQCEGSCIRGLKDIPVSIGKLEAYVCDETLKNNYQDKNIELIEENQIKIAIIGSGPAGLTCAVELRKSGYDVTIYEKEEKLGGVLRYGIPEYRLPKKVLDDVINNIFKLGIKVKYNICFGKDITHEEIFNQGYRAIFLGIGTEISKMLNVEGIKLDGVYGANDFLRNFEKEKYSNIVVVGGGNVAMDVARVARHAGANVNVIYRKNLDDMPANKSEINAAKREGVEFLFEKNILKINGETNAESVLLDDGNIIKCDMIVIAIGSEPNTNYLPTLKRNDIGLIEVDEDGRTNIENIFAGGDLVNKKSTACKAIKSGIEVAKGIQKYVK